MLKEITAIQDRCQDTLTCPAVFTETGSGKMVIIGKVGDFPELAGRIGPDEIAIEIDAGIVERALAGRELGESEDV